MTHTHTHTSLTHPHTESSLNLPKYQPKAKDINSFLTRVRSRKPQSAPVVAAIKSTPLEEDELEKGLHINK